ncbi:MAG: LysR family transcriptional regulator, partial [Dehalococcoidales bacterium]|nr:LysR family transcriptional regulator [Dehalococcoidales bacterium]
MHATVLRYFEAVVEEGSIRKAAERLHISPSAVNR